MSMPNDPFFQVGDLVEDFRGDRAIIRSYQVVEEPGKSNRVTVEWAAPNRHKNPDKTEYYASVFSVLDNT
jgi:hypothetical protein